MKNAGLILISFVQILLPGGHTAPNVPLGFVHIQYLSGGFRKVLIDSGKSFGDILMCGSYQMERCLTLLFCHFYLSLWHH